MLLGGRTAEEIALGEISTGAQNDLQRATDIARAMVTEFGMSDALGAINYDGHKRGALPRHRRCRRSAGSTRRRRRRRSTPRSSASSPRRTTRRGGSSPANRDKLETVTRRLLEIEVMEGDELRRLLGVTAGDASADAGCSRTVEAARSVRLQPDSTPCTPRTPARSRASPACTAMTSATQAGQPPALQTAAGSAAPTLPPA